MKKLLLIIICLITLAGCKKEDQLISEVRAVVNSEKKQVTHLGGTTGSVLMVQIGEQIGTSEFTYLNYIEGFDFEPGFIYVLKLKKEKLTNPPQDGSDTDYSLISVLSKTKN